MRKWKHFLPIECVRLLRPFRRNFADSVDIRTSFVEVPLFLISHTNIVVPHIFIYSALLGNISRVGVKVKDEFYTCSTRQISLRIRFEFSSCIVSSEREEICA